MEKNVLITGISGFVGAYLAKELIVNHDVNIFGLVRKRADNSEYTNITNKNISHNINMIEGDLLNPASLDNAIMISDPDIIFHLGAQSYVPQSFDNPTETQAINGTGTSNLLESIRNSTVNPRIVFAGSSEEYGLVISSQKQYEMLQNKYGPIYPEPNIPEVPINENNPLRPMSPYAVSKIYGDYMMRNYYHTYGLNTIISRSFNHEGAGRGDNFVTSVISKQLSDIDVRVQQASGKKISIGNVNAFRDWSHVIDIINGYILLAKKGACGEVYNQGSMRTNSVLSYILLGLEKIGYQINHIETVKGEKIVKIPTEPDTDKMFGINFEKTRIDELMLNNEIEYTINDKGIYVYTDKGRVLIYFDKTRFRPSEVPILLSDTQKIQRLGAKTEIPLMGIIRDQINFYNQSKIWS